jgi:hypothetical protein
MAEAGPRGPTGRSPPPPAALGPCRDLAFGYVITGAASRSAGVDVAGMLSMSSAKRFLRTIRARGTRDVAPPESS